MSNKRSRTVAAILMIILAGACATPLVPPTSPDALSQGRPGYVIGYLKAAELPDSVTLVPPPPTSGTPAQALDDDTYRTTRTLRDTRRWKLAAKHANLEFPSAADTFSCVLDMPISEAATPHLNILLRRIRADASRANDKAKDFYKRQRPYMVYGESNCTPNEKLRPDAYPSGHASIGWAWALVLAEITPERSDKIFARGLAFGQSRIVCGSHWRSDVEAGRLVGAATVSKLHVNPEFAAQLALARKEIESARRAGTKSQLDCAAETQALASGP